MKCDACGLNAEDARFKRVRTTNGGLWLCKQCLSDINRKCPLIAEEREACAKLAEGNTERSDLPQLGNVREIAAVIRARG